MEGEAQGTDRATPHLWDEMLDEFRALGGVADNVCLKEGRFGRGLFPRVPSKPIDVHIPESLLINLEHLHFAYYDLTIGPKSPAGAREKAFIENYEREFSWGPYRRFTEDLMNQFRAASPELRALIESPLELGDWLIEPNPKSIAERYFQSRAIHYGDRAVVMPIIELANHGNVATTYEIGKGIRLSGRFDGEILVRYELVADALDMFDGWGFAAREDAAFSLKIGLENAGIVIRREPVKAVLAGGVPFVPEVSSSDGKLALSHLLLGHKKYPRLAKAIFYRIMRNAGRNDGEARELFETIQHVNRSEFYKLLALTEEAPPQLGRLLRNLARFQLEAMSSAIGTREI